MVYIIEEVKVELLMKSRVQEVKKFGSQEPKMCHDFGVGMRALDGWWVLGEVEHMLFRTGLKSEVRSPAWQARILPLNQQCLRSGVSHIWVVT